MGLALFDFDGTLTTSDTIWPLSCLLSDMRPRPVLLRAVQLCSLLELKAGLRSNQSFKERMARLLLVGASEQQVAQICAGFHEVHLQKLLNREVFRMLVGHLATGDDVYLVSSNFDFFLRPLQQKWGLKGILATRTEVVDGKYTGRILGPACDGAEKLERVINTFGEASTRDAVAYGDSRSDSFLLDFVKTAHWVATRRWFSAALPIPTA